MQYCPNFDYKRKVSIDDVLSRIEFMSELGKGGFGNVYKVIYNNKVYAAKLGILNLLLSDIKIGCLLNQTKSSTGSLLLPESYLIINSLPIFTSTKRGIKYDGHNKSLEKRYLQSKSILIFYKLLTQSFNVIKTSDEKLYYRLVDNIKSIIFELLIALISMHKIGIIHDDLHSGNICFEKTNNVRIYNINGIGEYKIDFEYRPILIDFGESKNVTVNNFYRAEYWSLLRSFSDMLIDIPAEFYMFDSFDDLFNIFGDFKSDEVLAGSTIQLYELNLNDIKIIIK